MDAAEHVRPAANVLHVHHGEAVGGIHGQIRARRAVPAELAPAAGRAVVEGHPGAHAQTVAVVAAAGAGEIALGAEGGQLLGAHEVDGLRTQNARAVRANAAAG